ncbi:MAG: CHAT domain-containing tetratricopeptide repeat protein [Blastocatellia bacterium]|nr:CHAT domain-containing tetratricopeptide repeat protein [Blastocatellia bacterium]
MTNQQGNLDGIDLSLVDPATVDLAMIETLKGEVDRHVRIDLQHALRLAALTYELSLKTANPFARALGLRARAQTANAAGQYADSVDCFKQAGAIYQEQGAPVEAARMVRSMIDPMMYLGQYEEALLLADGARRILSSHHERGLLAQLETNVGNLHHRMDQYQAAKSCYEAALGAFSELNDQTAQAIVSFNLGNIQSNLDDFRQAQALYDAAYELYARQGMELSAAQVRYSIGYLSFLKGEYHQAMRILHETHRDFVRLGDERLAALCQLDLAEIYLQLNVYEEAGAQAAEARMRFESLDLRYEAAKSLAWFGLSCSRQERLDEAEEAFIASRKEFLREGNEIYKGLLDLYRAEIAIKRNRADEGLALATEACAIFEAHSLKTRTGYAQLIIARALAVKGAVADAGRICRSILASGEELAAPWLDTQVFELLGDLALAEGFQDHAYRYYKQSVELVERMRSHIRVDEFRSAFFREKLQVYEKLIKLCLAEGTPEKETEAFFFLESRKARTLVDMVAQDRPIAPADGEAPVDEELYRLWRQLREELHWYYSKAGQRDTNEKSRLVTSDRALQLEITRRERELANVARIVQIRDPHFAWQENATGMTVGELRVHLAPEETVVEYYFDEERLRIFVIDGDRLHVVSSPFDKSQLRELIFEYRFQMEKFRYGQDYVAACQNQMLSHVKACLHDLHRALVAPIQTLIAGRKLIFIPFDILHNVPFQALYDGERYLLDGHEISYAPSARLLALCRHKSARSLLGDSIRVVVFGAADAVAPKITEEIQAISALFPEAACFTGADANAESLRAKFPESDILHIACHAVFRQDNPTFSALKLSDGLLNFYDVSSMRSPASLVTLSGCSTGNQRIYGGDEILGLVRGFMCAGAVSLVVSLWAVNDPATAKLMPEFYDRVRLGVDYGRALREASLAIRAEHPHPYFWAPFVLIGQNRLSPFVEKP